MDWDSMQMQALRKVKYDDPMQGPTVRYVWSDGEITIKDLPRNRDLFVVLQQRIRKVLDEVVNPELMKAG